MPCLHFKAANLLVIGHGTMYLSFFGADFLSLLCKLDAEEFAQTA